MAWSQLAASFCVAALGLEDSGVQEIAGDQLCQSWTEQVPREATRCAYLETFRIAVETGAPEATVA